MGTPLAKKSKVRYKYICRKKAGYVAAREREEPMIKFRRNNVYMKWGLTAFVTVLAILAMYDILFGAHKIAVYFGVLSTILRR